MNSSRVLIYLDNYVGSAETSRLTSRENQQLLCDCVLREQTGWVQKSRFRGFSGSIVPEQKRIDSWRVTLEKMALPLAKL